MSKRLHNLGKFLQYLFHMQKLIEVCQSGAQSDTIISDTLAKNKSNHTSWEWYFFNKYYFLCGGIQMHFNSFVLMQRPALEYFLGTNKIGLKKKQLQDWAIVEITKYSWFFCSRFYFRTLTW